jgi:N6-adenosine-specific RNA methylase IME4
MKKYQIIYADPPWSYYLGGKKNASRHYKCMKIEDIYALPISGLADDNCALFLWSTFPMLPECIQTIKRWGFKYSTNAFTWVKRNKKAHSWFWGCGNYTRSNAEICLLGMKGTLKRQQKNVHQIIDCAVGEYSSKPDEVRYRIIKLFGDLPRIELFARQKTEGWDVWGNEVESDIELE